jgi:hypothetical protein
MQEVSNHFGANKGADCAEIPQILLASLPLVVFCIFPAALGLS